MEPGGGQLRRTGQQVKPLIEEIEQRIQFRSPRGGPTRTAHHQLVESVEGAENANAALVLRTPQQAENVSANIAATPASSTALTPHNPSKFAFLSAEKPGSGIKQFEADVIQKQAQYSRQINEMEARLATFHMKLSDESVERERELSNTVEVSTRYIVGLVPEQPLMNTGLLGTTGLCLHADWAGNEAQPR